MTNPLNDHVPAARAIIAAFEHIPVDLLEASAQVVEKAAADLLVDIDQHPGRRGNPALRAAANTDLYLAADARSELSYRAGVLWEARIEKCWSESAWVHAREVERAPAMGIAQWTVVARLSPSWTLSPSALYEAARAIVPEDTPLDLAERRIARLRRQARDAVADAERELSSHQNREGLCRKEADAARLRADDASRRVSMWQRELQVRTRVARLDETQLAAFAANITAGMNRPAALTAAESAAKQAP